MSYDPSKPVNDSLMSSAEMRAQLTGLKEVIDAHPDTAGVIDLIVDKAAGPIDGVLPLSVTISNPPTQAQVQLLVTKINELIAALSRA